MNDSKIDPEGWVISQIEMWDAKIALGSRNFLDAIETLSSVYSQWFLTMPSISEGKNYLYANTDEIKESLTKHLDAIFEGNHGCTPKLWLRKEILKKIM